MKTGRSIKGALNYNEQKVRENNAELILASHFGRDIEELGFSAKRTVFDSYNQLNPKSKVNTLHLSLNFSPKDVLTTEKLQSIAKDYMERIGFGDQPYLVYQHKDTTHPHIHIVATTIRSNGKAIYLHNIGKRLSEPARKAIELEYGLIQAESQKQKNQLPIQGGRLQSIVQEVVASYKFTALDELNAILRHYDIVADRGPISSRMFQNKGLIYSWIDANGYKTGVPIKSSAIYTQPTLAALEKKFEQNGVTRLGFRAVVQADIHAALSYSKNIDQFIRQLLKRNIYCQALNKENDNGPTFYFIDHRHKAVFTAESIGITNPTLLNLFAQSQTITAGSPIAPENIRQLNHPPTQGNQVSRSASFDLLKILLTTETHQPDISPEFLKKRRKRK